MKHFLSLADVSTDQIWHLLKLARELKAEWLRGGNRPLLAGKSLGMLFQKPSLRTRASFEMGMVQLGGHAMYLSPSEVGVGSRESVADVARVLSRYVDGIMARVFEHRHVEELAHHSRVPVINGLSDHSHPCQGLTDLFTIWEKKETLSGLRLAYVGDGNNVATALAFGCAKVGMDFVCAAPAGSQLPDGTVGRAREFASVSGSKIELTDDSYAAARGAHILYTDVWTSMGQEEETGVRLRVFPPYQLNARLMAAARPDVLVMHCLPAHRGQEITDEVADGPHSIVFDQAENRLHAQKAILATLLGQ
ncbi:MAG: ornithine carbamoyltransferase [Anaerolineae bacterium]|nr:ornithine carbamoyltransferase [Anaerolineae bacterium]